MKATFEVDLSDSAQVNALITFLQGAGTGVTAAPAKKETGTAKTTKTATATTTTAATTITQDELGDLTAAKVKAGHRDAIVAKLAELGAAKVGLLKPEQYEAYKTFLNSLK